MESQYLETFERHCGLSLQSLAFCQEAFSDVVVPHFSKGARYVSEVDASTPPQGACLLCTPSLGSLVEDLECFSGAEAA